VGGSLKIGGLTLRSGEKKKGSADPKGGKVPGTRLQHRLRLVTTLRSKIHRGEVVKVDGAFGGGENKGTNSL